MDVLVARTSGRCPRSRERLGMIASVHADLILDPASREDARMSRSALERFPIQWNRMPALHTCFVAISRREPDSASLEIALRQDASALCPCYFGPSTGRSPRLGRRSKIAPSKFAPSTPSRFAPHRICALEVRAFEICVCQIRTFEVRAFEVRRSPAPKPSVVRARPSSNRPAGRNRAPLADPPRSLTAIASPSCAASPPSSRSSPRSTRSPPIATRIRPDAPAPSEPLVPEPQTKICSWPSSCP